MAKINRMKRRRGGSKRLDLAPLKEILKDRRCWTCMGTVVVPEGESTHFELITTNGQADILVDVETQPEGLDLTCRMNDAAIYRIPKVGDEVAIVIPAGELSFMPIIVATMGKGGLPDGVGEDITVIANGEVLIHDGAGGAEELVKKSAYEVHLHPTGTGPSGAPNNATAPTSYTEILKAK